MFDFQFLIKGKLSAKGHRNMSKKDLSALVEAWRETGVDISIDDFGEPKPSLYELYKLLLNTI